jgi:hypothetical protein
MQISILTIIELLKTKLLEYPVLVDSLKNKDYNFLELLESWMKETETILKNNNIAQCAKIAGLRSKIIAPIFDESRGRSTKKRQFHIAAESMYEIQDTILSVINPYEQKVNEARDLLKHLLSILKQSGAIKYTDGTEFQYFINQIWTLFSTHEQLKPSMVTVLTLISQVDALRIIADEIELTKWK